MSFPAQGPPVYFPIRGNVCFNITPVKGADGACLDPESFYSEQRPNPGPLAPDANVLTIALPPIHPNIVKLYM